MSERLNNDVDPIETRDWLQAIESVIREEGVERAQFLIDQVLGEARKGGVLALQPVLRLTTTSTPSRWKTNLLTLVTWILSVVSAALSAGTR
jgi:pyruvate dehydrogenase complex dehydrogenase (E1) component